jgi:hypothetical protein
MAASSSERRQARIVNASASSISAIDASVGQ